MSAAVSIGLDQLPHDGTPRAVSIGKFDGVHRGHQAVIHELSELHPDAELTVVTFDRHPKQLLAPEVAPLPLVSTEQKIELLGAAGVERVVVIPFTQEFADLSPEVFARDVLAQGLSAAAVLVGRDFRYGHEGAGTYATLVAEGAEFGFHVHTVADVKHDGDERISSTRIRRLLSEGEPGKAAELLGRNHRVRSTVVSGHQRGRELGYPTANLDNPVEGFVPRDGVYATWALVAGQRYPAATSIGVNPTFGDVAHRIIESHLFGFSGVIYGEKIEVEFVDYIRPMNKFSSADALADQMAADALQIRQILS